MLKRLVGSSAARRRWAAALAGLALPFAFAPFGVYWLAPLSLAILFWCWSVMPARGAAGSGFWFGVAAFTAGTWWLYISVRLVGGTPLPVAVLLLGGLVALMAAYIAAAGYAAARLRGKSLLMNACVLMPACWVLAEWLRGWVLTGFPWLTVGFSQIDGPFAAWAPVSGVYGVSLVTAVCAGTLLTIATGVGRQRLIAVGVAVVISLATWGLTDKHWTEPSGARLRVSLVQGAIPQLLKWEPGERRNTMDLYLSMTESLQGQDLVIWPEAAIPAPDDLVSDYLDELRALAQSLDTQLLVGILTHDEERDEYYNSLLALGSPAGIYHKRHLVPFGEFFPVPEFIRRWMRMMNLPYSDIARGSERQSPLAAGRVGLAPTICYEDAYGAEQLGFLPEAQMLVNVSNDAWFGDTIAPHQHLQIARMRALETGRYMVRSTNSGITAIIDERGKILATAPQFERSILSGVAQPHSGATPYVRTGNLPVLVICLLALVGAARVPRGWKQRVSFRYPL